MYGSGEASAYDTRADLVELFLLGETGGGMNESTSSGPQVLNLVVGVDGLLSNVCLLNLTFEDSISANIRNLYCLPYLFLTFSTSSSVILGDVLLWKRSYISVKPSSGLTNSDSTSLNRTRSVLVRNSLSLTS